MGEFTIDEGSFSTPALHRFGKSYLGRCLALSLALHALLLSLQFGEPGIGLPWLAWTLGERRVQLPVIEAVLQAPTPAPTASNIPPSIVAADQESAAPAPTTTTTAASLRPRSASLPARTSMPPRAPARSPAPGPVAQTSPVLAVERDSAWRLAVPPTPVETDEQNPIEPDATRDSAPAAIPEAAASSPPEPQPVQPADAQASARALEEARERERLETAARLAEERRQAEEEEARLAAERQQAANAATMRQADALRRQQAEEAAAARAEAQARVRAEELAKVAAQSQPSPAVRAGQLPSAPAATSGPVTAGAERAAGSAGDSGAPSGMKGADLAARALAQARSGLRGLPGDVGSGGDRPRRGSILGGGRKDISLAFYGEAWREKVERIGEMNYPQLSKDRFYDQLVVTVSINSDGTLAGVRIDKSSGYADMDDAVRRIVEMSAPFAAFPPDLKRRYDVVDITRAWTFVDRPRLLRQ